MDGVWLRQRPWIGFVGEGSMSEELQFVEDEGCGGTGVGFVLVHGRWASLSLTAPRAAFMGDGKRDATGPAFRGSGTGASAEDGGGGAVLDRDAKPGHPAAENGVAAAIAGPGGIRSGSPLSGRPSGAAL
ncbi:hypothetical protein [Roseobacter weihaiensis]|uniref:hypothetical protein n=1 Tax=Roseobacter weihaiensis TaxID=2763262 RepID=UPI001D0B2056|nr:hypothetical protein [Roseobacter sp. H9]